MKEPPTMAQVLGILSAIVMPLIVWGVSVETRLTSQIYQIEQNAINNTKIEGKIDKINETTLSILLALEHLKD
tara:strand:+ start:9227 stop:9445 length:219 start_codon:yes stop_codon:yes gene_type:complete